MPHQAPPKQNHGDIGANTCPSSTEDSGAGTKGQRTTTIGIRQGTHPYYTFHLECATYNEGLESYS
jgi:hypothetical protein